MKLLKKLKSILFCEHEYKLIRTIHGDEIIHLGYVRSEWMCSKCNKHTYGQYLDRIK